MSRVMVVTTSVGLALLVAAAVWLAFGGVERSGVGEPLPGSDAVWPPVPLDQEIVVAADGDGRPGERFRSVGPSIVQSSITEGVRSDATVILTPEGGAFLVVVLGRASELGDPMSLAVEFGRTWELGEVLGGPTRVSNGLGETVRVDVSAGERVLTEWRVEREGWIYVVGLLRGADQPHAEGIAEQMIETWEWVPAGA